MIEKNMLQKHRKAIMRNLTMFLCLFLAITVHGICNAGIKSNHLSPDGQLTAVIISAGKSCNESKVEIYKRGKLLIGKDYFSEDCTHGQVVEYSRWTNDAQFFVFGMYSSGGHQAWAANIYFFDRRNNRIVNLNTYLPPVAETKFTLKAPDLIKLNIWTPFNSESDGINKSIILPITFSLKDVIEGEATTKRNFPYR